MAARPPPSREMAPIGGRVSIVSNARVEDCMQDLRLVGVHDDGEHLLLSGAGGEMFQLPIDEALRVAASRTPAKTASGAGAAAIAMSPRDIQARIRSGSTAAEVAELSGIPLAKVQRYE